jgi:ubiquinone/menaquinone biosynthesis C-methylase UbiE
MREARALAEREGLADRIDLREGSAKALPLPDGFTDVALCCTVAKEGDADRMFGELVRVTKPRRARRRHLAGDRPRMLDQFTARCRA